jgi:transposase
VREIERLQALGVPLYYLDECGIDHRLYREHGWSPRGERIYQNISGAQRKRTSVIAASRGSKLVAPFAFEGACNACVVEAYFEKVLLKELAPGSVSVLDNASFHKSPGILNLAQKANIELLFLPAYSPDLNPIEHIWSAFKKLLRKTLSTCKTPLLFIANMSLCLC